MPAFKVKFMKGEKIVCSRVVSATDALQAEGIAREMLSRDFVPEAAALPVLVDLLEGQPEPAPSPRVPVSRCQPPAWAGQVVQAAAIEGEFVVVCERGVFEYNRKSRQLEPIPFSHGGAA